MKRAIVYIVILGFVCTALGIVIGVTVDKIYTKRYLPEIIAAYFLSHPSQEVQRTRNANILKRLNRELDLSSEQRSQVNIILEKTLPDIRRARKELTNTLVSLRGKSISEISAILNIEQKEKFQKLIAQTEERWKKLLKPKNK
jgi:hypothetical protein